MPARPPLGSGFGEGIRGIGVCRQEEEGLLLRAFQQPSYLSHVPFLADSEQQIQDPNGTITCLIEEHIGLKWPGDFIQFRRREGTEQGDGQ